MNNRLESSFGELPLAFHVVTIDDSITVMLVWGMPHLLRAPRRATLPAWLMSQLRAIGMTSKKEANKAWISTGCCHQNKDPSTHQTARRKYELDICCLKILQKVGNLVKWIIRSP
jgi:hypothetical protein